MQLFYSPILGNGSCAVGIFTTGRLFAETSLGLFVSQSCLRAPAWNNFSPVLLLFNPTEPGPRCSILRPFKIKLRREKLTSDLKVLIFHFEMMGWGSDWVLHFSLGVNEKNLALVLAFPQLTDVLTVTESWLLEKESIQDHFKLKFSSKFPLPDCKTRNYSPLCPEGHWRAHICFREDHNWAS